MPVIHLQEDSESQRQGQERKGEEAAVLVSLLFGTSIPHLRSVLVSPLLTITFPVLFRYISSSQ
jgi:hypothetical protein